MSEKPVAFCFIRYDEAGALDYVTVSQDGMIQFEISSSMLDDMLAQDVVEQNGDLVTVLGLFDFSGGKIIYNILPSKMGSDSHIIDLIKDDNGFSRMVYSTLAVSFGDENSGKPN